MLQPTRKSRLARNKNRHRTLPVRHKRHTLRLTAILSFLCMAALAVVFTVVGNAQVALGQESQTTDTCNPTVYQTNNHEHAEKWFSINSGSTADILSAVQCTDMYQSALQGNDLIAYALQNGTLADPVLVKPYRSDAGMAQYWVVPVVDKNNYPLALLTFFYNPGSHQIHESDFAAVTNNMFYVNHTFPAVKANMAATAVSAEHHVTVVQGRTPELIYFPGDLVGFETGKHHWTAGGTSAIDPIWRVPGADGKWHYVDHDGHAHLNTEIPVDPNYQAMPSTTDTQ